MYQVENEYLLMKMNDEDVNEMFHIILDYEQNHDNQEE